MDNHESRVEFKCSNCGLSLVARVEQGGKNCPCPKCGTVVQVPRVSTPNQNVKAPPSKTPDPRPGTDVHIHGHTVTQPSPSTLPKWMQAPATVGQLLTYILAVWGGVSFLLFILSLFSTVLSYVTLLLFLTLTAGTVYQIYLLMRARQTVLEKKDIPLLWGFVRLVAWDPVEGVLFLQNKAMGHFDDCLHDGKGGIRFMYPILGEELALRVPLEVQTLQFYDKNVLTREYLSVTVHGTLKWRITNIQNFYLFLSRELRNAADHKVMSADFQSAAEENRHIADEDDAEISVKKKLKLAITWLRVLTEEQTRTVVSRVSSGLLIADRLADQLPELKVAVSQDRSMLSQLAAETPSAGNSNWTGAADGLARSIYDTIKARVAPYGIHIEEVSLQEMRLPEEVIKACVEAAQTAYLPLLSQRKAAAEVAIKRANLTTEVELLGRETVGTREVLSAAPGFTLVDFLSNFVSKGLASGQAGTGLVNTAIGVNAMAQLPGMASLQLSGSKPLEEIKEKDEDKAPSPPSTGQGA